MALSWLQSQLAKRLSNAVAPWLVCAVHLSAFGSRSNSLHAPVMASQRLDDINAPVASLKCLRTCIYDHDSALRACPDFFTRGAAAELGSDVQNSKLADAGFSNFCNFLPPILNSVRLSPSQNARQNKTDSSVTARRTIRPNRFSFSYRQVPREMSAFA